MRQKASQWNVT